MASDEYRKKRYDAFAPEFQSEDRGPLPLHLLRRTALWLGRRPVAGMGVRALRWAEYAMLKELGDRLDRAGIAPADPLGNVSSADREHLAARIFAELLDASRGTDQAAIEQDFYVRLLRQLNPSQARILVLMADQSVWPMVHVNAGSLPGFGRRRVLSYASSVGKEAGVLLRDQVPNFIAHMFSLGLIMVGAEDPELEPEYEILEAETLVRNAMEHIQDDLNQYPSIERCTIQLSEFGQSLCQAALPSADDSEYAYTQSQRDLTSP